MINRAANVVDVDGVVDNNKYQLTIADAIVARKLVDDKFVDKTTRKIKVWRNAIHSLVLKALDSYDHKAFVKLLFNEYGTDNVMFKLLENASIDIEAVKVPLDEGYTYNYDISSIELNQDATWLLEYAVELSSAEDGNINIQQLKKLKFLYKLDLQELIDALS
jgi:hypothetical protein